MRQAGLLNRNDINPAQTFLWCEIAASALIALGRFHFARTAPVQCVSVSDLSDPISAAGPILGHRLFRRWA
jgi:hypothetical protein